LASAPVITEFRSVYEENEAKELAPIFAYLTQRLFIKLHTKLRVSTMFRHPRTSTPAMGLTQPRMQ